MFPCSSHSSDGSVMAVTDKLTMHTQTPLECGNEAGPTNPRQTLTPNKRLQTNPVPQLFSLTLQAEEEMENLDMDVTATNPQRTADTEQARGAHGGGSCPQPHRNGLKTPESTTRERQNFSELLSNLPIVGSTNNPLVVEPDAPNQLFVAF